MHYCLIDTAIGTFGLGWTEAGVCRVALPGDDASDAEARMLRLGGIADEPQRDMAELEERIVAYAAGEPDAFADVRLDLSGVSAFNRRCYDDIRQLGWGETTTYGRRSRGGWAMWALSRAVGAAMGANPIPLIIPCHRVLAADGRTGGFSAGRRHVQNADAGTRARRDAGWSVFAWLRAGWLTARA